MKFWIAKQCLRAVSAANGCHGNVFLLLLLFDVFLFAWFSCRKQVELLTVV